ncbi:protein of unknown function, partial [Pseudomonas sp. JV551A1]
MVQALLARNRCRSSLVLRSAARAALGLTGAEKLKTTPSSPSNLLPFHNRLNLPWTAKLLAESIALGHSQGLDVFSAVPHLTFPGGKALRSPLLALG